ncbi:MAG: TlpA family protein disulfide reductase [Bacteroidales bacterium]|nr:TlpA family protein disulfide reductase [Bacteroidales bacterium]
MIRRLLTSIVSVMLAVAAWGQNKLPVATWEKAVMGRSTYNLKVKQVRLYDDRTELDMSIRKQGEYTMSPDIHLEADGKIFKLKSSLGFEPDKNVDFGEKMKTIEFILRFEPISTETRIFDLKDPNGWFINGIRDKEWQEARIIDTYWRDVESEDWVLGVTEKYVIVNDRIEKIANMTEKRGECTITTEKGTKIEIGKLKDSKRKIAIGNNKPMMCTMLLGEFMPGYAKEDRSKFTDNGYRRGDTTTIIGWVKDYPADMIKKHPAFEVKAFSLFTEHEQIKAKGKIDEDGLFVVKMPLENSQEVYMDRYWTDIRTVLEPGETYVMLLDEKMGQRLFMGKKSRVQNEILANILEYASAAEPEEDELTEKQYRAYVEESKKEYEKTLLRLETIMTKHPKISKKYEAFHSMCIVSNMAKQVMEYGAFGVKKMPLDVKEYINEEIKKYAKTPYTLCDDFGSYLYYAQYEAEKSSGKVKRRVTYGDLLGFGRLGEVKMEEADLAMLERLIEADKEIRKAGDNKEEVGKIREKYDADFKALDVLCERQDVKDFIAVATNPMRAQNQLVDSMYSDNPTLKAIGRAKILTDILNRQRKPLSANEKAMAESIEMAGARDAVLAKNAHYEELSARDISNSPCLKSSDIVAGLTDGAQILDKILEPYKGRLVLIDVWGTWCMPCKMALANSKEEYEELADYDIVYLYLANRSDEESWKNVIKEYDVLGKDIVHYNLPRAQQSAVERFLNVNRFPSFRLIDKTGKVVEEKVDARKTDELKVVLDKVK